MRLGVLGTGIVGNTLATKLVEVGHEVRMGSREPRNDKAVAWAAGAGEGASEGSFEDAAKFGERQKQVLADATEDRGPDVVEREHQPLIFADQAAGGKTGRPGPQGIAQEAFQTHSNRRGEHS